MDALHYMRNERIAVYSLTILISTGTQSLAAYCLFKYRALITNLQNMSEHNAHVDVKDLTTAATLSMTLPIVLLILLNLEVLSLLRRREAKRSVIKLMVGLVGQVLLVPATIRSATTVFQNSGSITGVGASVIQQITAAYPAPSLDYHKWTPNIAWVALLIANLLLGILSFSLLAICMFNQPSPPANLAKNQENHSGTSVSTRELHAV